MTWKCSSLPCSAQLLWSKFFLKHPGLCFYETPLMNHRLVSRRLVRCLLWLGDSEPPLLFPRRVLKHLAVECSQEGAWEIVHIAKHKRDHDASAQGGELSLWGRLLDSGLHPGKKVIYLTRAMTGNQDSLPEDVSLNCESAEAWSHFCSLLLMPWKKE